MCCNFSYIFSKVKKTKTFQFGLWAKFLTAPLILFGYFILFYWPNEIIASNEIVFVNFNHSHWEVLLLLFASLPPHSSLSSSLLKTLSSHLSLPFFLVHSLVLPCPWYTLCSKCALVIFPPRKQRHARSNEITNQNKGHATSMPPKYDLERKKNMMALIA